MARDEVPGTWIEALDPNTRHEKCGLWRVFEQASIAESTVTSDDDKKIPAGWPSAPALAAHHSRSAEQLQGEDFALLPDSEGTARCGFPPQINWWGIKSRQLTSNSPPLLGSSEKP